MHKVVDPIATISSSYDILLIGLTGVGKSSLVFKFVKDLSHYHGQPQIEQLHFVQVARNSCGIYQSCSGYGSKPDFVTILDSASFTEEYSARKAEQIKNARAVLFAYSVSDRESFEALEDDIESIRMIRGSNLPPFVIGGLKLDTYHGYQVLSLEGEELATRYGALGFHEVSAQENINVEEIFSPLIQQILKERQGKTAECPKQKINEVLEEKVEETVKETPALQNPQVQVTNGKSHVSDESASLSSAMSSSASLTRSIKLRCTRRDTGSEKSQKDNCCVIV